ncbi:MAG: YDG domain-containing protein [Agriterribacter sp.]
MNKFYPARASYGWLCACFSKWYIYNKLVLLLLLGTLVQKESAAQTTLAAGDLVFSAYDATTTVGDDKFSFILLTNISSGTQIYFTDRGYSASGWQVANGSTEGSILWTAGSALPKGTEVLIKSLSATVNGMANGTVTSVAGSNSLGLSLSHPSGDQIIAFQGGSGNPAGSGVTFIAGIHWNYCPNGYYAVYTNDAGWDNIGGGGSCASVSTNSSSMPPGLTGGVNAFWIGFYKPTAPATNIQNYTKGQFNGAGAPFTSMTALREAVLNRDNWIPIKSADNTTPITIPTGYTYTSSASPATVTTATATSVTSTSATLGGNVTADGGATVTERGIVWATTANPTTANNKVQMGSGTGSFSNTVSALPSGTIINFRAYAINTAGVSYGSNTTVTTSSAFSATIVSQTNVACNGGSTGVITVTATGGTAPYTYSWSPAGGTAATASGLAAGTYTVTVTDQNSNTTTATATITQSSAFTVTTLQTNVSCNGASNGSATVNVSGATGPYYYSWAPSGGTGKTASGLVAGNYTVTIMDENSCQTTKNFTITQPPGFTVTTSQTNVSCNGGSNGSATVNVSGATGPYSYSWSPSGGTGKTASGLTVGNYTVTITDANNCQTTKNFTITQPPGFTVTTSQTNVSCNGGSNGSATVNVSGGTGAYYYSWSPSGGTAKTASGLTAGNYTVTITDANSCQTTKNFTITQPSGFTVTTSQTNVSCNGGSNGSATVNVSGGAGAYYYSWSPSGGTGKTASGLTAGNYTVTITDANSCQTTRNFTITQPAGLSVTTSQTNISCNGGSNGTATVNVTGGSGAYTYSWSPSGGTGSTATGLVAGNYTVTITDASTCQTTRNFTITQPAAITINLISQTNVSCNGGSNGAAKITASGGTGGYSYQWYPSGGTSATATGLTAAYYSVVVTDANSCQTNRNVTIAEPDPLNASVASQTNVSCNGGSNGAATISVSGGTGSYTYSWSPSGGTGKTATGLAAGTYTCTITDANSCQTTKSVTITEPSAFTATTSQINVSCNGGSNGSATVNVSGGSGSYYYSWSPSGGTGKTASGLAAGNYTVTITDANTCQTTRNFTITQPAAFTITTSQINVSCNGGSNGSATVNVSGGSGSYYYSWSPSGGTGATASGLAAGNSTVPITDANNCQTTKNFTITQPPAFTVTTSQTNISCNGGSNGSATVNVSGGAGAYYYSWSPSGGTGKTATGLTAGNYTVTITDANSCQTTRNFTITQPAAFTVTTSQTNISCNGGSNGSATVNVSGATGPYYYSWSPSGGTGKTATGLTAGNYTVTITDANSCQTTRNFTITQPAAFTITTSQTNVSCNGGSNGSATVNVSGATGPYYYSWSPSGGTGKTATGLAAGNYTVTITDANTCQTTRNFTITQPVALTASATPASQTICSGEQTNIALSSSPSGADFSWTVSNVSGNVSGASASSGSAIQQTLTGSGVVKYIVTPDNGTCTGPTVSVAITVYPLTVIEMHPSNKSVYDEESTSFSIEADNASAYQWQVDEGDGFINISNNSHYSGATSVTLTVSDITGSMNGYRFRCVASGNCAPVASNDALLSVKTRTAQTISFATTDEKVYGSPDFVPQAGSSAGLDITFTSSDESIAAVVDDKVHIKKAGEVIITASQPGNDDYKPATSVQQTLSIAKRQLTVSLLATPLITKVYDGNAAATLATENYSLENRVEGDDITVVGTAAYENSKAGTGKKITAQDFVLSGSDKDNYSLGNISAVVKGDISPKSIEVSILSAPVISKTYDGTNKALLQPQHYNISGVIGEDEVSIGESVAAYADKKAGFDKTITVNGFVLAGADKGNYALSTESATASGDILAKEITASFAQTPAISKTYDGNTTANIPAQKYQLNGVESGDDVLVSATAVYDNSKAGEEKTVTASAFELQGGDKDNYLLTTTTAGTTGSIQKAVVKVILQHTPAVTKVYDGTTKASLQAANYTIDGIIGEDEVLLNNPSVGTYDTKHGGTGKNVTVTGLELSGMHAANYLLKSTTVSATIGVITRKEIAVVAQEQTRQYGSSDPALSYTAGEVLEGDELEGELVREEGKNAGTYAILIGTLSGGDDYNIVDFTPSTLTITPAPLTIKADDKVKKQGAANPVFTFSYEGLAEGDQPADIETPAIATTSAGTGSPIGYYDIEVSGASSPNYTITFEKGKLTVTPASDEKYSLKVWNSSPDMLQVRIYSDVPQKAAIILYTETGQQVILQQKQLNAGINTYSVYVGNIASSTYILGVAAEKFKKAEKVKVK